MKAKNMLWIKLIVAFVIGLVIMLVAYNGILINIQYPDPIIQTYYINNDVPISTDKVVNVKDGKLYSLNEIYSRYPEYKFQNENVYANEEDVKVFLIQFEMRGLFNEGVENELGNFILQSGAWSNGWDLELYSLINQNTMLDESGQSGEMIYLPYFLYEFQFNKREWNNLEKREFWLVTAVYPEKRIIKLSE